MLVASFITAVAAAPELEALDRAIARCDRVIVNPTFADEVSRRSSFLTQAFREQEQIVSERLQISEQRRTLREANGANEDAEPGLDEAQIDMAALAVEDRQRALNDRRLLETLRQEAMDAKRRVFLSKCVSGRDHSKSQD